MKWLVFVVLVGVSVVGETSSPEFTCPEDFGYFPHPSDCTQYYVCVFGGALLESCTGGLMYSHDLQTCDWPRNVFCFNSSNPGAVNTVSSTVAPVKQTAYAYNPIKIETYGQLNKASAGSKKVTPLVDEYQQQRSGRSYEGALPNYKEEIYQPRRLTRDIHRGRLLHRVSSPGNILYPSSYFQTPTYGFVNLQQQPTRVIKITTSKPYLISHNRLVDYKSVSPTTRSKYTAGTTKYFDQQQPNEYDTYANQRYAANANNTNAYYYTPGQEEDSSYYVYEDEEEPENQDFDYRANYRTTTTTTARPTVRAKTRGSSTRTRPTNKPKASVVKASSGGVVRDVYLDAPSRPLNVYETPVMNTPATKCRKDLCVLPDCSCGGKEIPGGLKRDETPQIVLLTFDDSVNDLNKNLYRDLFEKGRKNPNGCPISATFYISHEWTDYSQVQNLAADGHEIASHSVSHSFGEQYSQKKWDKEINGQREILAAYGGVKLSEVRGMRAPFLAIGGNNMFKMLHDSNFTYDSSMPIYENRPPSWPYTLDYRIFHDCMIPPCPTKSYPGVWEVPMVMWQDLKGGRCSMGDACSNPPTAEGVYQMLAKNFERHYTTNRAPFGLYYHAAWFTQAHHKEGFEAFLDTLVTMDDVWVITNHQALQWIRSPVTSSKAINFSPWSCHDIKDRPPRCNHPKVCNLWHKSGVRYMKTCQQCPQQYPWTGNTGVPYSNSI